MLAVFPAAKIAQWETLQQSYLEVLGSIPPGRNVDLIETSDGETFQGVVRTSS